MTQQPRATAEDLILIAPIMQELSNVMHGRQGMSCIQLAVLIGSILAEYPSLDNSQSAWILEASQKIKEALIRDQLNDNG